ncbi:hypothetical protein LTR87_010534 [Friedmanniomyces endolithicus]|nr:hypothetical protein LTR87_010534 [Friedmanniomyces endolithicus]
MGPRYVDPFQRAPGGFDEDGASIFIYPEWEQLSTRKIARTLVDPGYAPHAMRVCNSSDEEVEANQWGPRALAQYYRRYQYKAEVTRKLPFPIYDIGPRVNFNLAKLETDGKIVTGPTFKRDLNDNLLLLGPTRDWSLTLAGRIKDKRVRCPTFFELLSTTVEKNHCERLLVYAPLHILLFIADFNPSPLGTSFPLSRVDFLNIATNMLCLRRTVALEFVSLIERISNPYDPNNLDINRLVRFVTLVAGVDIAADAALRTYATVFEPSSLPLYNESLWNAEDGTFYTWQKEARRMLNTRNVISHEHLDPVTAEPQTKPLGDYTPSPSDYCDRLLYDGTKWTVPWEGLMGKDAQYKRRPMQEDEASEYAESDAVGFTEKDMVLPNLELADTGDTLSDMHAETGSAYSEDNEALTDLKPTDDDEVLEATPGDDDDMEAVAAEKPPQAPAETLEDDVPEDDVSSVHNPGGVRDHSEASNEDNAAEHEDKQDTKATATEARVLRSSNQPGSNAGSQPPPTTDLYDSQQLIPFWRPRDAEAPKGFRIGNTRKQELKRKPWVRYFTLASPATADNLPPDNVHLADNVVAELVRLYERGALSAKDLSTQWPQTFDTQPRIHDHREPFGMPAIAWNDNLKDWVYLSFDRRITLYGSGELAAARESSKAAAHWMDNTVYGSSKKYNDAHLNSLRSCSQLYLTKTPFNPARVVWPAVIDVSRMSTKTTNDIHRHRNHSDAIFALTNEIQRDLDLRPKDRAFYLPKNSFVLDRYKDTPYTSDFRSRPYDLDDTSENPLVYSFAMIEGWYARTTNEAPAVNATPPPTSRQPTMRTAGRSPKLNPEPTKYASPPYYAGFTISDHLKDTTDYTPAPRKKLQAALDPAIATAAKKLAEQRAEADAANQPQLDAEKQRRTKRAEGERAETRAAAEARRAELEAATEREFNATKAAEKATLAADKAAEKARIARKAAEDAKKTLDKPAKPSTPTPTEQAEKRANRGHRDTADKDRAEQQKSRSEGQSHTVPTPAPAVMHEAGALYAEAITQAENAQVAIAADLTELRRAFQKIQQAIGMIAPAAVPIAMGHTQGPPPRRAAHKPSHHQPEATSKPVTRHSANKERAAHKPSHRQPEATPARPDTRQLASSANKTSASTTNKGKKRKFTTADDDDSDDLMLQEARAKSSKMARTEKDTGKKGTKGGDGAKVSKANAAADKRRLAAEEAVAREYEDSDEE